MVDLVSTPNAERAGMPRALTVLLAGAAGVILMFGLRELAWFIGPVFLALVIVLVLHPLNQVLVRRRVPRVVVVLAAVSATYALVGGLAAIVLFSLARLATVLPSYAPEAAALLQSIDSRLSALGIGREQVRNLLAAVELNRVAGLLTSLLRTVLSFATNTVFFLSVLLFLAVDATSAQQRMAILITTRPRLHQALIEFAVKTRRFLAVTTVFAVIVGAVDTVLLWALGIPLALLWGILAAVCNYIPYVGFVIGLIPPALLALLLGGWQLMLIVIVAYVVVNSIITSLVPPYFVGDAVGMAITLTLLAVVFWGWVLGPLGAVLAIPLTLFVKAILVDSDPRAAWAEALIGSLGQKQPRKKKPGPVEPTSDQ